MEEEDELIPKPDFRGFLDLTSRAWVNLDPVLWTMYVGALYTREVCMCACICAYGHPVCVLLRVQEKCDHCLFAYHLPPY